MPQDVPLPAVALEAADRGAVPLAYVLAQFGVPTGLVTTENPSDSAFAWTVGRLAEPPALRASEAAGRLMRAHPRYQVEWARGVLSIVERDAVCGAPLAEPRVEPIVIDGDLSRAFLLLTWMSGDMSSPPAGTVSGPPGARLASFTPLSALKVNVAAGATLGAALDEAVRVSGGGAWIVWQHDLPDGRIGCRSVGFYPNGQVGASRTDFRVIERQTAS